MDSERLTPPPSREITSDMPLDEVMVMYDLALATEQQAKQIRKEIEAGLQRWIEVNGEVQVGTTRFYVGTSTTTKCRSNLATTQAVLEAAGGDVDVFVSCLSAGAFKPGATKKVLQDHEAFDALFSTEVVKNLKTGEPRKKLNVVDTRFIR